MLSSMALLRKGAGGQQKAESDLFAEVDINNCPTFPGVQSQYSSIILKEGPIVSIATNNYHGHVSDLETLETPMKCT